LSIGSGADSTPEPAVSGSAGVAAGSTLPAGGVPAMPSLTPAAEDGAESSDRVTAGGSPTAASGGSSAATEVGPALSAGGAATGVAAGGELGATTAVMPSGS
jgi:hypothetical protein